MGFYNDQVLPRLIDRLLGVAEFAKIRAKTAAGLSGEVVEVGFGSGLNVPHYPAAVSHVQAIDPATVGRKLAAKRVAATPIPIEYVGLDGQSLPQESGSVDHVLITWTLCTIPDVNGALGEMYRILRPGGQLHFVEHGRAPEAKVAAWQDRLTPLQKKLAGGCHLNRSIDSLIVGAGFELSQLETFYVQGPKPYGYMYQGLATRT